MTNLAPLGASRVGRIGDVQLIDLNLRFQNLFGPLGPEKHVTGHWTAGPADDSLEEAIRLCHAYHRDHTNGPRLRAGGIAYHYCLPRTVPYILLLRPVTLKGAHVGGHNSGNVGVMAHGGAGGKENRRPTEAQVHAFETLLRYAHTRKFPRAHRTDRPLRKPYSDRRGHNDWSGHSWNACPGTMRPLLDLRTH